MNPFEFLDEFFIPKTRVNLLGLSVGGDFVILASVVFTQCQRVTDRQTGRRTDRQTDGRTDGQSATIGMSVRLSDRRTDMPIVANTGLCIARPVKMSAKARLLDVKRE